jgi:hypothetical protein
MNLIFVSPNVAISSKPSNPCTIIARLHPSSGNIFEYLSTNSVLATPTIIESALAGFVNGPKILKIVGVANTELVDKYSKILPELGCKRAIIVHGLDGLDEIATFGETKMRFIEE